MRCYQSLYGSSSRLQVHVVGTHRSNFARWLGLEGCFAGTVQTATDSGACWIPLPGPRNFGDSHNAPKLPSLEATTFSGTSLLCSSHFSCSCSAKSGSVVSNCLFASAGQAAVWWPTSLSGCWQRLPSRGGNKRVQCQEKRVRNAGSRIRCGPRLALAGAASPRGVFSSVHMSEQAEPEGYLFAATWLLFGPPVMARRPDRRRCRMGHGTLQSAVQH